MKNKNKLVFSFGTMDKKKLKTYFDFLKNVHSAGKRIVDVDLSKNTIAKMKFYEELQKNIHFIANDKKKTVFGSFFSSFISADDALDAKLFINSEVADLFFDLPEKDFLYRPLRSKYAKLIYNKLGKNNGTDKIITVSRSEIIYDWGIDTDAKMSQFILRLPLYVDEINGSGLLDGKLNFSIARASEKKQSRMVAVLFQVSQKEETVKSVNKSAVKAPETHNLEDDCISLWENEKEPEKARDGDSGSITGSSVLLHVQPKNPDQVNLPKIEDMPVPVQNPIQGKVEKRTCPVCHGKIVTCTRKNGSKYECCEKSQYNINIADRPSRGTCTGWFQELDN